MRRERIRHENEHDAKRAVLARFGDPSQIARQLWFDAMKEKIMYQRLTLITNIIVALAAVTACIVVIVFMQRNAAVTQSLTETLKSITATSTQRESVSNWTRVDIPVRLNTVDGQPAAGHFVRLRGAMFNPGETNQIEHITNENGLASFGPIRPGEYTLRILGDKLTYTDQVTLYPGKQTIETVVWPVLSSPTAKVQFELTLPEDIAENIDFALVSFDPKGHDMDDKWDFKNVACLITPDGKVMRLAQSPDDSSPIQITNRMYFSVIDRSYLDLKPATAVDADYEYRIESLTLFSRMDDERSTESERYLRMDPDDSPTSRDHSEYNARKAVQTIPAYALEPDNEPNRWEIHVPAEYADLYQRRLSLTRPLRNLRN